MPVRYPTVIRSYLRGTWVDITSDVRKTKPIEIIRGLRENGTKATPQSADMVLNDTRGDYSPDDPTSVNYGTFGRNTPIEVLFREGYDSFGRTLASAWGTSETGLRWSIGIGSGGSVLVSDYAVNMATGGRMSVPAAPGWRAAYLADQTYRNADVTASVLMTENPDGGALEPGNILLRVQSGFSDYYMTRVSVDVATSRLSISFHTAAVGQIVAPVDTGVNYNHSDLIMVRAQIDGETLRGKVWVSSAGEPLDWQVTVHTTHITTAGYVGIRHGVASGNSDTKPVVFDTRNFTVYRNRFYGEISEYETGYDDARGRVRWTRIRASGVMRRLGQNDAGPRLSPLRRKIPTLSNILAYWPCEDPKVAQAPTGYPPTQDVLKQYPFPNLAVELGRAKMAANDSFYGSAPLPDINRAVWLCSVPSYNPTTVVELQFVAQLPVDSTNGISIVYFETVVDGLVTQWHLEYRTGGSIRLNAHVVSTGQTGVYGPFGFNLDGRRFKGHLVLTQVGSNVTANLAAMFEREDSGAIVSLGSGTFTALTNWPLGRVTEVAVFAADKGSIGHIFFRRADSGAFHMADEFSGFHTERAVARLQRIGAEEGMAVAYRGPSDLSARLGYQGNTTTMAQIQAAADTDQGVLCEPRGSSGILYVSRRGMYNQVPALTLDVSGYKVVTGFRPVFDDRYTRNSLIGKRTMGGERALSRSTGPMSTQSPPNGIGTVKAEPELNTARIEPAGQGGDNYADTLIDALGFQLARGTTKSARFPNFKIQLNNLTDDERRAFLDIDCGERVDVIGVGGLGVYGRTETVVLGYRETASEEVWTTTLVTAPYGPFEMSKIQNPTFGHRLAPNTPITIPAGISTTTATTFVVSTAETIATTATHPTSFPFPIEVNGEEMSVTGIVGTTFTVIRSANGVIKTHPANSTVGLKFPFRTAW